MAGLLDTEIDIFGTALDPMSLENTSTSSNDPFSWFSSKIDSAFSLYESGVQAKIGAANTMLDYPKLIINGVIVLGLGFLTYKVLVSNKKVGK